MLRLFCANNFVFNVGLCEMTMAKRCLSGLGPCSIENCNEACCKKICNNDYSGLNPSGYCDMYPGYPGQVCLCEHDCYKA